MKKIPIITFCIFLCLLFSFSLVCYSAISPQNSPTHKITKREVLKAISFFENNPFDQDAARTIALFAEQSDEVMVVIDSKFFPWMDRTEYENSHLLLAAFLAGNVKKQLSAGTKNSEPYDGIVQLIKTYLQLRKANKINKIHEIENWSQLTTEELKSLVFQLQSEK